MVVGVCRNREIGVDIEKVRSDFELMSIASRFFTPNECETLRRLPEPERAEAFFHCWTRKEAVLKARGDGLSFPLDRVEVSVTPEEAIVGVQTGSEEQRWRVMPLNVPAGYVAAVALSEHQQTADWCRSRAWFSQFASFWSVDGSGKQTGELKVQTFSPSIWLSRRDILARML